MKFIDRAKIFVRSGQGGNGKLSFLRLPNNPKGGPDGGDGGNGGSIVFQVDPNIVTLVDFVRKVHFKAPSGGDGGSLNCHGKNAKDLVIKIPVGTQIYDEELNILFFDAVKANDVFVLLQGGKGGLGNARFVSATNRAPIKSTEGEASQELWIRLVLKLFCDYGLIGLPNAGKSTLLQRLTGSNTKVGAYPFTTVKPHLGAIPINNEGLTDNIILADLPGLIKGASENKGLGFQFLGHIERCKGILHVVDVSLVSSLDLLELMLIEIEKFSPELLKKRQIVVLNKVDLVAFEILQKEIFSIKQRYDFIILPVSANTSHGLDHLVHTLSTMC